MEMTISKAPSCASLESRNSPAPVAFPKEASAKVAEEAKQAKRDAINSEKSRQMIEDIQTHINNMNVCLTFSTYGRDNVCITVTEKETGRVVREIPPKELQKLYEKMNEIAGLIFSDEA